MKKIPTPHLEDILESISRIKEYIAEIDEDKEAFGLSKLMKRIFRKKKLRTILNFV